MRTLAAFKYRGFADSGVISSFELYSNKTLTYYTNGNPLGLILAQGQQATATLAMNSDGTVTRDGTLGSTAWHFAPAAGLGASFWALVTLASGAVTTGTVGSRVQLTNGQVWTVTTVGTARERLASANGTYEVWDAASGGNLVSSGPLIISANYYISTDPVPSSSSGKAGISPESNLEEF